MTLSFGSTPLADAMVGVLLSDLDRELHVTGGLNLCCPGLAVIGGEVTSEPGAAISTLMKKLKVEPSPALLFTESSPLCISTSCLDRKSPKPEPASWLLAPPT